MVRVYGSHENRIALSPTGGGMTPAHHRATRLFSSPSMIWMPTMKKPPGHKMRKKQAATPIPPEPQRRRNQDAFPIVGIGASAGGLEALELFLRHVPEASGMAFVIVQHLDPTHKGIMVELLQRATRMPVVQVRDRQKVAPDRVYVIPPNKDMSILRGTLHLLEPVAPRGLRLPIDFFFRAMADDCQTRSIGVILSGMGSDGTLGLRSIKEKAGVVFVQAPASAKFDGMPRSAVDAGLADVVAPAEQLPGRIIEYLNHVPRVVQPDPSREGKTQSALEKVFILLRTQTRHDFSPYKKSTIYRRVERRMGCTRSTRSPPTSGFCAKTRWRSSCSPRSF
jgi:two-component system, chemotaxis family, CheB/CheR fusion protein